jgi:toxin ParE1/3/4
MRVHWTNQARARLKLIYEYINEESPQSVIQMVDKITTRSIQLGSLPNSGRQVPEYRRNDAREVLEKPYRISYKVKSEQIDVLTTIHYRQILPADVH